MGGGLRRSRETVCRRDRSGGVAPSPPSRGLPVAPYNPYLNAPATGQQALPSSRSWPASPNCQVRDSEADRERRVPFADSGRLVDRIDGKKQVTRRPGHESSSSGDGGRVGSGVRFLAFRGIAGSSAGGRRPSRLRCWCSSALASVSRSRSRRGVGRRRFRLGSKCLRVRRGPGESTFRARRGR